MEVTLIPRRYRRGEGQLQGRTSRPVGLRGRAARLWRVSRMMESMGVMPMPMPMRTMVLKLECSCAGAPKGPSRMIRGACRADTIVEASVVAGTA